MLMKIRSFLVIIPMLIVSCTYYHRAFQKDSQFYTEQELSMVAETTSALTFGYGYEADVELDYIFAYPYSKQDFNKKKNAFDTVIRQYRDDDLIAFYEKMYYLRSLTSGHMEGYKKNQEWKRYTFLREYLLPPLEEYLGILESGLLSAVPQYRDSIEERKLALLDKARKEVLYLHELRQRRNTRKALNGRAIQ